ncbi:LOW QUALITY PROTEIN: hypothetical protein V2J09_020883 [Rumex salicifolius]
MSRLSIKKSVIMWIGGDEKFSKSRNKFALLNFFGAFRGKMPFFEEIESFKLKSIVARLFEKFLTKNPNLSSHSFLSPFGKLKEVNLVSIKGLICLFERWISHLTIIQVLSVSHCEDLLWVSRCGLTNLIRLKEVKLRCEIGGDEEEDDDEKQLFNLRIWYG